MSLAVVETHPVQYHAPVYRALQHDFDIPVRVIYGSDFSVAGYRDQEFGSTFAWQTDLLSGYVHRFLSRVGSGGAAHADEVNVRGLRRALAEEDNDAVMLLGYRPAFYTRAALNVSASRKPILMRAETTDHARSRTVLKSMARTAALRALYARCSALLYVGRRSLGHYERLGVGRDRLYFSPYCVDTTAFRSSEADRAMLRDLTRKALNISPETKVLLFAGKLVPRKDPLCIVEAARKLHGNSANVVVVFLGSGILQDEIAAVARAEPAVGIRFLGFQNQNELSAYYHASDMLILPSLRDETWGLVVNEALHHGLPCIISDAVGCAPDLVNTPVAGGVFRAGETDDLVRSLRQRISIPDDEHLREKRRAIVANYSVHAAARGIAEAHNAVVRRQ